MNEQKYNNQEINAYLLGSLPEPEAERFDELSFTDDEFADALKSAENDLIDAYIHDELDVASLEKFKIKYLASPVRREKVEFAKAFQTFARDKIENSANSETKRVSGGLFSKLNIFKNLNPVLQWGFVAASVFIVLAGLWVGINRFGQRENELAQQITPAPHPEESPKAIENMNLNSSNDKTGGAIPSEENNSPPNPANVQTKKSPSPEQTPTPKQEKPANIPKPSIASFVLTPSLRSNNRILSLSISKETTQLNMQLQLEANDYSAYRVTLNNQADRILWRSGSMKAMTNGENKQLNVRFPANLLKSQVYSLVVSGVNAAGEVEIISNYPFRAVIK